MTEPAIARSDPSLATRLLALSREAHALAQHEVAYHALTASMHAADDEGDVQMLGVIQREAEAQIGQIDRTTPAHRLSSRSASRHAHPGVYAMLARQASMHIQMHDARELPGMSTRRDVPRDSVDAAERPPGSADQR